MKMLNDEIVKKVIADHRLTVSDIALFFAIMTLCRIDSGYKIIQTSRKILMARSHIGSLPTYHKSLKQLVRCKYIIYIPSYHPKLGSRIGIRI